MKTPAKTTKKNSETAPKIKDSASKPVKKITTALNKKAAETIKPATKTASAKTSTVLKTVKKNKAILTKTVQPKKSSASTKTKQTKKKTETIKTPLQKPKTKKPLSKTPKVSTKKRSLKTNLLEQKIVLADTKPKKPRKKPLRPIGTAVFRGKKSLYDFKVFHLNETFEPIQAVYVISKRITDKRKRGHHSLICIGQTNSVIDEIKKHRKSRCLQKNAANVISILREENEETRLKIATDLRAAHSISCSLEAV